MIFWDVDTQVDFISPQGKLCVPGAETIVPNLARLTACAQRHNLLVVASMDAHQPGDAEFAHYPPHCLVGTPGQVKIPETQLPRQAVLPSHPVDLPADLQAFDQIILEKQQFDVFTSPNTEPLLGRLGREAEFVLYGVVTEICVACAARGLLERGFRVRLVRDAVHHLDAARAHAVLSEIEALGGRSTTTEEVVSGASG